MMNPEVTPDVTIEFPCPNYPVKIIGQNTADFSAIVLEIVCCHCPEFDPATAQAQPSSNGRFVSLRVNITAQGVEHLQLLNDKLRDTGLVHMVL